MQVLFGNEDSKNELLRAARYLKVTKYKTLYVVQNLTVREREHHKVLMEERDKKKSQGLDLIIVQGKLVPRRQRDEIYINGSKKSNLQ